MGFVSTILGFCGFGVGISAGLVIGYYLFIYFQPCDVKVLFLSLFYYGVSFALLVDIQYYTDFKSPLKLCYGVFFASYFFGALLAD